MNLDIQKNKMTKVESIYTDLDLVLDTQKNKMTKVEDIQKNKMTKIEGTKGV